MQIVQIVQCIFFERCVQKLSVSGSCIFLVILNHFRPCCLPVAYLLPTHADSISAQCRLHHPFLSHLCDNPSSSIFVPSLRQPLIIHFCPIFGTTVFLSVCPLRRHSCRRYDISCRRVRIGLYSVRRSRSVFCQRSGLTVKSLQFAVKNRKKALLFAYMEKKLYLCTRF